MSVDSASQVCRFTNLNPARKQRNRKTRGVRIPHLKTDSKDCLTPGRYPLGQTPSPPSESTATQSVDFKKGRKHVEAARFASCPPCLGAREMTRLGSRRTQSITQEVNLISTTTVTS